MSQWNLRMGRGAGGSKKYLNKKGLNISKLDENDKLTDLISRNYKDNT